MSIHLPETYFESLYSLEQIRSRCKELGQEISKTYKGEPLVAVGILRGCQFFYSELLIHLTCPVILDFMFVSSYGDSQQSSGLVKIERDLKTDIRNRHVLLVDDIADTGYTLQSLQKMLALRNPKSVALCTMLDKPASHKVDLSVDFAGFSIPDYFVVGFGLDYQQYFRNTQFIGKLKEGQKDALDRLIDSYKA